MVRRTALWMLLPLLAACSVRLPLPERLGGSAGRAPLWPAAGAPIPPLVQEARTDVREHRRGEARRKLEEAGGLDPAHPERSWLLTALWTEDCGTAHARSETAKLPAGPFTAALRALAAEDPAQALDDLRPYHPCACPWVHLAAGINHGRLGDTKRALSSGRFALRGAPDLVRMEAHMTRARAHLAEGRVEAAARSAELADVQGADARVPALRAQIARATGALDEAAAHLLDAIERAPGSEVLPRRLADLLRDRDVTLDWEEMERRFAGAASTNPERIALRGWIAGKTGRRSDAISHYRSAIEHKAVPVPIDRDLRRVLFEDGRYAEGIDLLRAAVPPDVLNDRRNLRKPHWDALWNAAADAEDVRAPDAARAALGKALVGVGALPEALSVLAEVDSDDARSLAARVQGHVDFENALREMMEAEYRVGIRQDEPASFEQVLRRIAALARTHVAPEDRAAFRNPARGLKSFPFVGTWLDHHTHTSSPVVAHFRKYGRFAMLGQRSGSPSEAIVMSMASLTCLEPLQTAGGTVPHDVAIGYDRTLQGFTGAQGGEIGGACLADGIWLDADSARMVEYEIRRALERDEHLLATANRVRPPLANTIDGPFAMGDEGCAVVRLIARYVERRKDSVWGSFGTLRAHEFGHALDIHRHLPVLQGLPASLALLFRNGLSPTKIEMELEERAQLTACVFAPDPDLALAEMLLAFPVTERVPEVHAGGYRDGVARICRHVYARPDLYPQIDRSRRIVAQLDQLTNEQIRRAARAALRR